MSGGKHQALAAIWTVTSVLAFAIVMAISGRTPLENLVDAFRSELHAGYALATSLSAIWTALRQSPAVLIPGVLQ